VKIEFQELTALQEDELEKNLIWVFTMGRSGSSWLARELLSFNTYYINEPSLTNHLGAPLGGRIKYSMKKRIIDHRKENGDYFFSEQFKHVWNYYLRKLVLNRIYVQIKDTTRKIIIKEASINDASDVISEILPNCKVIILYRDGRDVVDSQVNARLPGGWVPNVLSEENKLNFIEKASWDWVFVTENLLKTANSRNHIAYTIKYEDLLSNTFDEMKKIYKFLEIDISDDGLQKIVNKYSFENIPSELKGSGKFYRSASPGKWKENFIEEEQKLINEIMGTTLQKLGYDEK